MYSFVLITFTRFRFVPADFFHLLLKLPLIGGWAIFRSGFFDTSCNQLPLPGIVHLVRREKHT